MGGGNIKVGPEDTIDILSLIGDDIKNLIIVGDNGLHRSQFLAGLVRAIKPDLNIMDMPITNMPKIKDAFVFLDLTPEENDPDDAVKHNALFLAEVGSNRIQTVSYSLIKQMNLPTVVWKRTPHGKIYIREIKRVLSHYNTCETMVVVVCNTIGVDENLCWLERIFSNSLIVYRYIKDFITLLGGKDLALGYGKMKAETFRVFFPQYFALAEIMSNISLASASFFANGIRSHSDVSTLHDDLLNKLVGNIEKILEDQANTQNFIHMLNSSVGSTKSGSNNNLDKLKHRLENFYSLKFTEANSDAANILYADCIDINKYITLRDNDALSKMIAILTIDFS